MEHRGGGSRQKWELTHATYDGKGTPGRRRVTRTSPLRFVSTRPRAPFKNLMGPQPEPRMVREQVDALTAVALE